MPGGAFTTTRSRLVALVALAVLVGAFWLAQRIAVDRTVALERTRLENVAALAANNFRRQVDTFQLVATTLSADPEVRRVLEARDAGAADRLNERLATLSATLDTSVIYLLDRAGTTVVSSNWRQPDSFLGENYRFRSYFTGALAEGRFSQFALGTRSGIPGLFLARRIEGADGPVGVLVVKIRFDRLEREWARSIGEAFISDADGVILVTSNPSLRFRTITPVSDARRDELRRRQAFGDAPLALHPAFSADRVLRDGPWHGEPMLAISAGAAGGRTMTVVAPVAKQATAARNLALGGVGLAAIALAAATLGIVSRQRLVAARVQEAEQRRVADLKARLEQANRLSSLGQVAAGVGHEINQPLAAIGMRADSVGKLLAAGRLDDARRALEEIDGLVVRAGAITAELRKFARRSDRTLGRVRLRDAFDGLAMLMGDTLSRKGARLVVDAASGDIAVIAEQVRLEQVLVNLVQNALDAGGHGCEIAITVHADNERVRIVVRDDGPGIAEEAVAALFQPFSSTKPHGLGLGLVICRDIVSELGGELSYLPDNAKGAAFAIDLRRAP